MTRFKYKISVHAIKMFLILSEIDFCILTLYLLLTFMKIKKFTRNTEDFTCEICNKFVQGDGYTNHCPFCFFSKHVDINPGDRAAGCGGMMKPIAYTKNSKKGIVLVHKCLKCGQHKNNKLTDNDNLENLLKIFHQG